MPAIWRTQWAYLSELGGPPAERPPIVIGEFGGKYDVHADKVWQDHIVAFLGNPDNRIAGAFY
eukprot:5953629-Prymnesium_polylepis.1